LRRLSSRHSLRHCLAYLRLVEDVNCVSANVSNSNVPSAPWSGFWYYLTYFIRCNIILFFSFLWIGITGVNIYVRVALLCVSFALDRIAVRKAEDVAIKTVNDFKFYAERDLIGGESSRRSRDANYFILMYCLLVLVEILVHKYNVLSNTTELYANLITYEIFGVLYFYLLSAYLFDARLVKEKLKNESDRNHTIHALSRKWVLLIGFTVWLAMMVPFLHDITKGEYMDLRSRRLASADFNNFKYGLGCFSLILPLTIYASIPVGFKVEAYAHSLDQKART
jgi:hypothetical protein